jgi:hypothetical protein
MDKRKVIAAYRSGLISVLECAQILGVDNIKLIGMIRDSETPGTTLKNSQSVQS